MKGIIAWQMSVWFGKQSVDDMNNGSSLVLDNSMSL